MSTGGTGELSHSEAGVATDAAASALAGLLGSVNATLSLRRGTGRPVLPIGYYANVLDLGGGRGLAISTDGVGTKALVAQMLGKYDTIGIDCVAMNANDIICVGAEPVAMTDYLGVEVADPGVFRDLGKGLLEGARRAGISIPGGEVAEIPEMIRGAFGGQGFDLVGTCVGLVPLDRILTGRNLSDGDVIIGLASSGIHSNGLTLARKVLLQTAGYGIADYVPELGRTLGEELLEPTIIYVSFAVEALNAGVSLKALAHITGDGLLNLNRMTAEVSFELEDWLEPPAVFQLIQEAGEVPVEEMYRVFNMGVGLIAVIGRGDTGAILELAHRHGHVAKVLGHVRDDAGRAVRLRPAGLQGQGSKFTKQ
jgi:phosphoribosylformylglycinamidine cyclo-ligase